MHLLTILGTTLYEPACYGEDTEAEDCVRVSLVMFFHNELKNRQGRVTVFLTEQARLQNWEDQVFTDRDRPQIRKAIDLIRNSKDYDANTHTGLRTVLQQKYPDVYVEECSIPVGSCLQEIMSFFMAMYECINENDVIIFDITHSFRSILMLAMAVINYARLMKNIKVKGVYYGAFEAGAMNPSGFKKAPAFDLSIYNEILEWSFAASDFINFGNAESMKSVAAPLIMRLESTGEREIKYYCHRKKTTELVWKQSGCVWNLT